MRQELPGSLLIFASTHPPELIHSYLPRHMIHLNLVLMRLRLKDGHNTPKSRATDWFPHVQPAPKPRAAF